MAVQWFIADEMSRADSVSLVAQVHLERQQKRPLTKNDLHSLFFDISLVAVPAGGAAHCIAIPESTLHLASFNSGPSNGAIFLPELRGNSVSATIPSSIGLRSDVRRPVLRSYYPRNSELVKLVYLSYEDFPPRPGSGPGVAALLSFDLVRGAERAPAAKVRQRRTGDVLLSTMQRELQRATRSWGNWIRRPTSPATRCMTRKGPSWSAGWAAC